MIRAYFHQFFRASAFVFFLMYIARVRICNVHIRGTFERREILKSSTLMSFADLFNQASRSLGKWGCIGDMFFVYCDVIGADLFFVEFTCLCVCKGITLFCYYTL